MFEEQRAAAAVLTVLAVLAAGCGGSATGPAPSARPAPSVPQPSISVPSISVPTISIPTVAIPTVSIPTLPPRPVLVFPTLDFPQIDLPELPSTGGVTVRQGEGYTVYVLDGDVLFDFDQATIRPDAAATLTAVYGSLTTRAPTGPIVVQGHTDAVGDDAYNLDLSRRRATAVADFLTERGLDRGRLSVEGFGEKVPAVPNTRPDGGDDPAGRQQNRRVEIAVPPPGG